MICYRDITFCGSKTHKPDCDRQFTAEDAQGAKKWWGSDDAPVAFADFCGEKRTDNLE